MVPEHSANHSPYQPSRQDLSSELNSLLTFIDDFQDEDLGCRLVLANSVTSLISEIQKLEPSADDIRTFKRLAESYYAHTLDANMRVQVIVNPPKNRNDWASLFKDLRDVALILTKKQNGETDRESANREIHSRIALLMSTVFAQMEVEISIRLLKQAPQANLFNSADPEYQKKLDQTVLARLYFLSVLSSITRGEKVSIPDPAFQETAIKWLNLLLHGKNEITQGSTSFKGLINKLSTEQDASELSQTVEEYKSFLKEELKTFSTENDTLYSAISDFEFPTKPLSFWGLSLNVPQEQLITVLFERAAKIIVNQNPKMQIEFSKKLKDLPEMMFMCEALRDSSSALMADNILQGLNLMLEWSSPPPKSLSNFPILDLIWDFPENSQESYISNLTQVAAIVFENHKDEFFRDGIAMLCSYIKTIKR